MLPRSLLYCCQHNFLFISFILYSLSTAISFVVGNFCGILEICLVLESTSCKKTELTRTAELKRIHLVWKCMLCHPVVAQIHLSMSILVISKKLLLQKMSSCSTTPPMDNYQDDVKKNTNQLTLTLGTNY